MFPEDPHEFQDRSLSPGPEGAEDEEQQPPSGSKANERDKERGRSIRFSGRLGLSEGRAGSPTQAVEESDEPRPRSPSPEFIGEPDEPDDPPFMPVLEVLMQREEWARHLRNMLLFISDSLLIRVARQGEDEGAHDVLHTKRYEALSPELSLKHIDLNQI